MPRFWVKGDALALPVGGAFDDEGVGSGGESVDRGLGQQGVAGEAEPFGGFPVRHPDGGGFAVVWRSTTIS